MRKVRVTTETVRRANDSLMKKSKAQKRQGFVPDYKLPEFKYDKDKVNAAWSRVLRAER